MLKWKGEGSLPVAPSGSRVGEAHQHQQGSHGDDDGKGSGSGVESHGERSTTP